MGTIVFQGQEPFELVLQKAPTASSEGECVVVNVPVFAAGSPLNFFDVRMPLSIQHAEQLAAQLASALTTARAKARKGV